MARDYSDAVAGYLAQGQEPILTYQGPYMEILKVLQEMRVIDNEGILLFKSIQHFWASKKKVEPKLTIPQDNHMKMLGLDTYIRKIIKEFKCGLPPIMRRLVWTRLLGAHHIVSGSLDFSKSLVDSYNDDSSPGLNRRIIRCDVDRTRSSLELFRRGEVKLSMEAVLSAFTNNKNCSYKQGMNEILAPFMSLVVPYVQARECVRNTSQLSSSELWSDIGLKLKTHIEHSNDGSPAMTANLIKSLNHTPIYATKKGNMFFIGHDVGTGNLQDVFELFSIFVVRYVPYILRDDDLASLQCVINRFQLLLYFFDPLLAVRLTSSQLSPELYVIGWFVTVFACKTQLDLTLNLWDRIIAEDDPFFTTFLAVALLVSKRDQILKISSYLLPEALSRLTFSSHSDVHATCAAAKVFRSLIPVSFIKQFEDLIPKKEMNIDSKELLKAWENEVTVSITATELMARSQHAGLQSKDKSVLQWILVDVRPDELVKHSGRFSHVQVVGCISTPSWLSMLAKSLQMQTKRNPKCEPNHCVVLMAHFDEENPMLDQLEFTREIHRILTHRYKIAMVCVLKGGARAWHDMVLKNKEAPSKKSGGLIGSVYGGRNSKPLIDHNVDKCPYCTNKCGESKVQQKKSQVAMHEALVEAKNEIDPANISGVPYSWAHYFVS